jgi:methylamine dehydrogenase accessory protein MauD
VSSPWAVSIIALWAFTLFLAVLVIGALRQLGLINLRLGPDPGALLITESGLDRGVAAPDFEAVDVRTDEKVRLHDLPGVPRVLTFVSPSCMACQAVLQGLNEVIATREEDYDFLVVCRDSTAACARLADMAGSTARIVADPTGAAELAFGVEMTPFAYLIDGNGIVLLRGVANDWRGVESLLNQQGTIQTASWAAEETEKEGVL